MSANPEENQGNGVSDRERQAAFLNDIIKTRQGVTEQPMREETIVYADMLIWEVEQYLEENKDVVHSKEELEMLLRNLDTAIAISNEPYARELRAELIKKYES